MIKNIWPWITTTLSSFFRKRVRVQYILIGFAIILQIGSAFFMGSRIGATANSKNEPISMPGILVSIGNEAIGVLKSEAVWYTLLDELEAKYAWFIRDAAFKEAVTMETAPNEQNGIESGGKKKQPVFEDASAFKRKLVSYLDRHTRASILMIEGEPVLALDSQDSIHKVLDEIMAMYTPSAQDGDEIKELKMSVAEEWDTMSGIEERKSMLSTEEAKKFLLKGTLEEKTYVVAPKDTIWSISKKHNLSVEDAIKANPGINPDRIFPGDSINLIVPKPYIHVTAEYIRIFIRQIPFATSVIRDDSMYRTETTVERAGVFGGEKVTAKETLVNGRVTQTQQLSSVVLSQPVVRILRQGTKRTPEDVLVASCMLPDGVGKISSYFGPRWGTFHAGIDLGIDVGTPIHAFKSGAVTFAGYSSKFGYYVDIDHADGLGTRYGHCSELLVKRGDTVSKGQRIALSGNTGYSTGPHVHFEIHLDGKPIDPLRYLKNTLK